MPLSCGDATVTLAQQLSTGLEHLQQLVTALPEPFHSCVLFFSVAAPGLDSTVFFVRRATFEAAWREGATRVRQWAWTRRLPAVDLRIDWAWDVTRWNPVSGRLRNGTGVCALADDDLEHAELVLPHGGGPAAASADAQMTLLLHLRGLHIDGHGRQTALPRLHWPIQRPVLATLPLQAVWQQLSSQREDGTWPGASPLDQACLMYALLQLHRHAHAAGLPVAPLVRALHRAAAWLQHPAPDGREDDLSRAVALLTLARYVDDFPPGTCIERAQMRMALLAGELQFATRPAIPPNSRCTTAIQLLARSRCHPWRDSLHLDMGALTPLIDTLLGQLERGEATPDTLPPDAEGLVIATLEHLETAPPSPSWHDIAQRLLPRVVAHTVRPELAMLLPAAMRDQAAFLSHEPAPQLIVKARSTIRVLLVALALHKMANT